MDLTKTFSDDQFARALESWGWLHVDGLTPRFTSLFGDTFFEAADGSWWFLDQLAGTLSREWTDAGALTADLGTEDGQDRYLIGVLAMAAHRNGIELAPDEVYAFAPHPAISGDFSIERIMALKFVVALFISGQMHEGGHASGEPDRGPTS